MASVNMGDSVRFVVVAIVIFLTIVQPCQGRGKIEIKMTRYHSSCTDNWGTQECDTFFYLCIDKPGPWDLNCFYGKYGPSSHYENTNNMEFGGNIGGITNPMVVSTPRFDSRQVMFVVQAYDDEFWSSDEHLVTVGKTVIFTPALDKRSAAWTSAYMHQSHYHVWFQYQAYCDAYYHTSECDVYCKARDDSQGHYTCNATTGEKICMRGWTGNNCNVDIDECLAGPCSNNAPCHNLPGTYECVCTNGYTGQDCNLVDSLCHSAPCQNGGSCSGDMENYTCACSFEWTGRDCETQVDFCEANPCENSATCYGTIGNYTCVCSPGWNGTTCTTEVDACDSAPCQNGAPCSKLPQGEYQCGCKPEHEGKNCEALKNPCDPNPCQNSGNCSAWDYDNHNCSCVYGWDGPNCSSYLVISNEQQQGQTGADKSINWVPIVIAFVCALLIVTVVLALIYFRRRRRQKKELKATLTDAEQRNVQPVAGRDNLAFRNALYDNQANSLRDQSDSRAAMPVPPTPTADQQFRDEWFYPTKPGKLPDDEEQGAVGGANPYSDIDGVYIEPVKHVEGAVGGVALEKDTKQKTAAGGAFLDTRNMAGGKDQLNAANDYADFGELQRRSIAARQPIDLADPDVTAVKDHAVENHYQELDDVILDIQNDPHGAVHFTPTSAAPPSHYDTLPPNCDFAPPEGALGAGYMSMTGGSAQQAEEPERLDSTDDEEDDVLQEDLKRLRQEVLQGSTSTSNA
ncbi:delta-like protein C [Littorina saxatilis]|uniref:delta-like protein C n=1 Tax=Littorina saxatilis TaxID=31220 RepID=UPI0038B4A4D4